MIHEEFMVLLERYYGEYPDAVRVAVWDYVFERIDEKDLEYIYKTLLETYSRRWKQPPDIAEIKKIIDEHNNEIPYDVNLRIGHGNKKINNRKLLNEKTD